LGILCTLRDKIAEKDTSLTGHQAMDRDSKRFPLPCPRGLEEFGRRLESGRGADACLDLLRPAFEDASLTLRDALSIVDIAADPATFLQTASAEEVAAYQRIGPATVVLDRLSAIAAMLGPLGAFPCVEDPRNVDPTVAAGWLSDVPVMCCSSDLLASCAQFLKPRPVGDVRSSPWLKTVPFLRTIASATERLRGWAERDWAAQEAERLKGGRLIDGVVVPDAARSNPFALDEAKAS